jgi:hypothetical protein
MRSANCITPQGIVVGRECCDPTLHLRTMMPGAPRVRRLRRVSCIVLGCSVNGHAAALPNPAMKARRRILDLPRMLASLSRTSLQ